ncbi:hypothetical protein ASE07_25435 [Noviherbaspirillum sp. Root189]|nr:hypothetical protein ASE07_25435 [Noviherbaspirillum sp. Root189]
MTKVFQLRRVDGPGSALQRVEGSQYAFYIIPLGPVNSLLQNDDVRQDALQMVLRFNPEGVLQFEKELFMWILHGDA